MYTHKKQYTSTGLPSLLHDDIINTNWKVVIEPNSKAHNMHELACGRIRFAIRLFVHKDMLNDETMVRDFNK